VALHTYSFIDKVLLQLNRSFRNILFIKEEGAVGNNIRDTIKIIANKNSVPTIYIL